MKNAYDYLETNNEEALHTQFDIWTGPNGAILEDHAESDHDMPCRLPISLRRACEDLLQTGGKFEERIVHFKAGFYLSIQVPFPAETADRNGMGMDDLAIAAKKNIEKLFHENRSLFHDVTVLFGHGTGKYGCHEIFFLVPAMEPAKDCLEIRRKIEDGIYTGLSEAKKDGRIFKKECHEFTDPAVMHRVLSMEDAVDGGDGHYVRTQKAVYHDKTYAAVHVEWPGDYDFMRNAVVDLFWYNDLFDETDLFLGCHTGSEGCHETVFLCPEHFADDNRLAILRDTITKTVLVPDDPEKRPEENSLLETFLQIKNTDYTALVAAAVLQENGLADDMSGKLELFINFAANISTLMDAHDDSRFTLADYLNAVLTDIPSGPSCESWTDFAKCAEQAVSSCDILQMNRIYDSLQRMAGKLRRYYEKTDLENGGFA